MTKYRNNLPFDGRKMFLTDTGLETILIFHEGLELPCFAAFDLLRDQKGTKTLRDYYIKHLKLALQKEVGFVLETPTWRASKAWGDQMDYSKDALHQVNVEAVELMKDLRDRYETDESPMVISGQLGPQGDGYVVGETLTIEEAKNYHSTQIKSLKEAGADIISALTMTYNEEAIGITLAAKEQNIPVVISYTVETDGTLPSGQKLSLAILELDDKTGGYAEYIMINCAHPSHFENTVSGSHPWTDRIKALRTNASKCSHAELDEATELDDGNPEEYGKDHLELTKHLKNLHMFGGCCGTDFRHIEAVAKNCI